MLDFAISIVPLFLQSLGHVQHHLITHLRKSHLPHQLISLYIKQNHKIIVSDYSLLYLLSTKYAEIANFSGVKEYIFATLFSNTIISGTYQK